MIIKFAHGITKESEVWEVYGDIDHYSFMLIDPLVKTSTIPRAIGDGKHFFTEGDFTDQNNENRKWEFFLYRRGSNDAERILVQSPVFILNDEGKTVDRV
jgi:hypothetical protein